MNICSSPEVQAPSNTKKDGGIVWSLPYSLSIAREETEKGIKFDPGNNYQVYDCVYHPDTITMCKTERFQKIVIATAIEGIEKQFDTKLGAGMIP